MTGVTDAFWIDRVPLQHVVNARNDVLAVLVAPRAPRRPFERLAVSRRTAKVRVENEVAVRGKKLFLEIERVSGRRMRAAVTEHNQGVRSVRRVVRIRKREPAFYRRAVRTRPLEAFRFAERHFRQKRA